MRKHVTGLALAVLVAATGCTDDIGHHRQALNDGGPPPPPDASMPIGDGGVMPGGGDINLNPPSFAFGDVRVLDFAGSTVNIQNTAGSTLTIFGMSLTGSSVFSQNSAPTPLTVGPGSSYSHGFGCQPLGVGTHVGAINISSSDPDESTVTLSLSCRGVKPDILVNPTSVPFGGVPVGGSSSAVRVTISNANNPTTSGLTVTSAAFVGANPTNFSKSGPCASGCNISPGGSSYIDVVFSPTAVGGRSATLRLSSNDVETPTTDVPLTGTGQQPNIALSQPTNGTLAFGDVNVGQTSSQQPVTVRNDGNLALSITGVSLLGANASSFAISNGQVPPPSFPISAGGQASWLVTCTPATAGAKSAVLRVASNDPDQPNTDVTLTCNGTQSALTVSPSPVSFGTHRVGAPLDSTSVMLQNTGGGSLTISALALTGDSEISIVTAPSLPLVLASGGTSNLTLGFLPTDSSTFSATLVITSSDPNSPTNLAISGTGEEATIEVTPGSPVDLGPVCVGLDTDTMFAIASVGTGPFEVSSLGASPAAFTIDMVSSTLPVTLDGTATLDFRLRTHPTGTGPLSGQVSIGTDLPTTPLVIDVSAVGIASGLAAAPASIDFGQVAVGEDSDARVLTVSNCAAGASVTITGVDLTGGDAIGFRIDSGPRPPPDEVVPRTESRSWDVVFQPARAGSHVAALTIATTGGDIVVPLSGSASGGDPDAGPGGDAGGGGDGGPGADGDNTYYACTLAGSRPPFTLILVALAGVLVARRRSRRR